jgi:DNA-binding transcriptional LysR family regulator
MQGFGPRWRFRQTDGAVLEVPIRSRVSASSGMALRQCAVAGMGVLLLPRWNVAEELRRGDLLDLFPDHEATASEFDLGAWLLYPSRSYLPLKVRTFADFLKQKFKGGPPAEAGLSAARRPRNRTRPKR